MTRLSIAAVAAVSSIALVQFALAADLPRKAPAFTPPPLSFSWTGFYIGGNAGYGWGNAHDAMTLGGSWLLGGNVIDNHALTPFGNGQLKPNDFTGGIQGGYNYQIAQWVLGIEADANYFGLKDDFSSGIFTSPLGSVFTFASSFESKWLVTVRPRLGYAFDRLLVYATGGLAIANQKFSQTIVEHDVVFGETGSVSKTTVGWTAGAGIEYALDNRWSVKAEYLYVDPGSVSFSDFAVGNCNVPCSRWNGQHSAHLKANIARAGINFRLN